MIIDGYKYKQLIHPSNLFNSVDEFKAFIEIRDGLNDDEYLESLRALLVICEEDELYEYCQMVNDKINTLLK